MTTCERCGHDIPENIAICPNCGTVTIKAKDNPSPATSYGAYTEAYPGPTPAPRGYPTPYAQDYRSQQQSYNAPPIYQQAPINITVIQTNNNIPLIVELLLTIFLGVFGVGWLIAGEITIGVVLLACSLFIYLPLLIISIFIAFFTFGLSLFCTGPMIIGAIILNALFLNNRLKRKAVPNMPISPI